LTAHSLQLNYHKTNYSNFQACISIHYNVRQTHVKHVPIKYAFFFIRSDALKCIEIKNF